MVIKKGGENQRLRLCNVGWRVGPDEIDGFGHFWAERKNWVSKRLIGGTLYKFF